MAFLDNVLDTKINNVTVYCEPVEYFTQKNHNKSKTLPKNFNACNRVRQNQLLLHAIALWGCLVPTHKTGKTKTSNGKKYIWL